MYTKSEKTDTFFDKQNKTKQNKTETKGNYTKQKEGEEKENKEKEIDTLLSSPNDFSSSPSIIKNINSLNLENDYFADNNFPCPPSIDF